MGRLYSILLLLSLIWGTSFMFIKVLLETLDPAAVVFGRCLFGVLVLLAIFMFKKKKQRNKQLPLGKLLAVAVFNNVLPWLLISSSETKISSSAASIINASTPIWTLIIGFLFFAAALRKNQWVGAFIGFFGIFILSDVKAGTIFSDNTLGIFLMTGATICYGLAAHLTKKHLAELSPFDISVFTLAISTLISFLLLGINGFPSVSVFFEPKTIIAFAGLGAIGSGIAYLLYYDLVQKGGPEFAALVTYLVPISALIWGALLLDEKIHPSMIAGLVIIFTGVYISSLKFKKDEQKTSQIEKRSI